MVVLQDKGLLNFAIKIALDKSISKYYVQGKNFVRKLSLYNGNMQAVPREGDKIDIAGARQMSINAFPHVSMRGNITSARLQQEMYEHLRKETSQK